MYIELSKEQLNAVKQLRRSFTRCQTVGLNWHDEYGTLQFFPKDVITRIDDDNGEDTLCIQSNVYFESVNLERGEWSYGRHYAHFTPKGVKKYINGEDEK
jgi:hypothetical protein